MAVLVQKADLSAASFANNSTNAAGGISVRVDAGSVVHAAIAAQIAALPIDKYVTALQSYNATTNTATFLMSDGTTFNADWSALLADAVATITTGKVPVYGNDGTTLLGYLLPV